MTFIIGTPHTHNAGYFRNDDRPGGGKLTEADIQSCPHCQGVIKMQEWHQEGGWCAKCEAPLCNNPFCIAETSLYGCVPFVRKLESYLKQHFRVESFKKLAGLDKPSDSHNIIVD
jgi:hypothetical protein